MSLRTRLQRLEDYARAARGATTTLWVVLFGNASGDGLDAEDREMLLDWLAGMASLEGVSDETCRYERAIRAAGGDPPEGVADPVPDAVVDVAVLEARVRQLESELQDDGDSLQAGPGDDG